jgi:predicted metalloprotease
MKYKGRRGSGNIFDRRGSSGGRGMAVGGGIGGLVIALIIYFLGGDPSAFIDPNTGGGGMGQTQTQQDPGVQTTGNAFEDDLAELVSVTLADTEDVWTKLFRANGQQYDEPELILFSGSTQSGCGFASSATGPFYCPADERVYIDLSFYKTLRDRFGATGDFAMAYVVAHEVGHHIQQEFGITDKVHSQRGRLSKTDYNQLQVRLELQADYLAGVWAHHADRMFNSLEQGDIQEALNAANAIGDDKLQKETQGRVVPDSFTHGTSAQRMRWFRKGFETGDPNGGNTFELAYTEL